MTQHIVGHAKCFERWRFLVNDFKKFVVGNDEQRIDIRTKLFNAGGGLVGTNEPFKLKRPRDDRDHEWSGVQRFRDARDDRRAAGSGSAAHAGGDEQHVGALNHFAQPVFRFLRRLATDRRISPHAQTFGELLADLNADGSEAPSQRLRVGVGRDEFDVGHFGFDHPVDRVDARAAKSDHADDRGLLFKVFGEFDSCHVDFPLSGHFVLRKFPRKVL